MAGGEIALQALADYRLGLAYRALGDYRQAIDCLRQTVAFFDGTRRHESSGESSCLRWTSVPHWPYAMPN